MEFDQQEDDVGGSLSAVRHLYSSTTPCVNASGSSNVMSKKVKARKITEIEEEGTGDLEEKRGTIILDSKSLLVYVRRTKDGRHLAKKTSFFEEMILEEERKECGNSIEVKTDAVVSDEVDLVAEETSKKRPHSEVSGSNDIRELGFSDRRSFRENKMLDSGCGLVNAEKISCKKKKASSSSSKVKKWVELV